MKQLVQNLKNGKMQILEAPLPAPAAGQVLVRNHFSVISAGTEGKTARDARLGYLAKAKARQKEMRQVLQAVKTQGVAATYRLVMDKLEAPAGLGYSCAGEVIAAGSRAAGFTRGDLVACGGGSAVHAEVVAVPVNLCVRVPAGIDLRHAAFTTIAAIALQGMRRADLRIGEVAVVIGLGLVGQLTLQLLGASGVEAVGIDIDPRAVDLAKKTGARHAFGRGHPGLEEDVLQLTRGLGADSVIIAASTDSLDPVNLAGVLCRQRGRVVVVGGVPTGFDRANYYRKELDLRMSCSYGPGRYDPVYEEKGIDYPPGYVRWTEKRNMQAFLDLLAAGRLNVAPLISHSFPLDEAPKAYDMILQKKEPYLGIVIAYDAATESVAYSRRMAVRPGAGKSAAAMPAIGLIGAGSFAQNVLLPELKKFKAARLVGVATAKPAMARHVAGKYGFAHCSADGQDIIEDPEINTVFIATRHDSHAALVMAALKAGKHVFVEKPLCLTEEELKDISTLYSSLVTHHPSPLLMVGFNRRFAPLVEALKAALPEGAPRAIHYRINAGRIPASHWSHDPEVGGGRIVGEACHFIDLAIFIAGAPIRDLSGFILETAGNLQDTFAASLGFADGSVASISYFSNGSPILPKEHLEVFCAGNVAVIEDFRELAIYGGGKVNKRKMRQDKGHGREVAQFLEAVRRGGESPIPFADIAMSMLATFKIAAAARSRTAVQITEPQAGPPADKAKKKQ